MIMIYFLIILLQFFISLPFTYLQKLPDPAAPSHTITISYIIHCDEWSRNDSNTVNKIITGLKIRFKKDQTGEIIAS